MRIIALAALALLLTGCVHSDPDVTPVPVPTTTPLFATDADALKAAEAAYAAYQASLDAAFSTYDTSNLSYFATADALKQGELSVGRFESKGEHQVGSTRIIKFEVEDESSLTDARLSSEPGTFYACLDFSGVDVVDSAGNSVIPANGPRQYSMEVSLKWNGTQQKLLVSKEEVWSGSSVC